MKYLFGILTLVIAAILAWWWDRRHRSPEERALESDHRVMQEFLRLSRSDPEAATRLLEPHARDFDDRWRALRSMAPHDPNAAVEFRKLVQESLTGAEEALVQCMSKNPALAEDLQREVLRLREDLEWARQYLPPPPSPNAAA